MVFIKIAVQQQDVVDFYLLSLVPEDYLGEEGKALFKTIIFALKDEYVTRGTDELWDEVNTRQFTQRYSDKEIPEEVKKFYSPYKEKVYDSASGTYKEKVYWRAKDNLKTGFTAYDYEQLFLGVDWTTNYGGEAWAGIAHTISAIEHETDWKKLIVLIDHLHDLGHNTGKFLDKFPEWSQWFQKLLDEKATFDTIRRLMPRASSQVQKLIAAYFRLRQEDWRKPQYPQRGFSKVDLRIMLNDPETPTEVLKNIAQYGQGVDLYKVLKHPNAKPAVALAVTKNEDIRMRSKIAEFSGLNPKVYEALAKDPVDDVRLSLAYNTAIPENVLKQLTHDKSPAIVYRLLRYNSKRIPIDWLAYIADLPSEDNNIELKTALAQLSTATPEILEKLANDASDRVRMAVLYNEKTPLKAIETVVAKDKEGGSYEYAVRHPNVSPELIKELYTKQPKDLAHSVAKSRKAPPEILRELATTDDSYLRSEIAQNPSAPEDILLSLITPKTGQKYIDEGIIRKVARNPGATEDILLKILDIPNNAYAVEPVVENPNVTEKVLQKALKYPSSDINWQAKAKLKELKKNKKSRTKASSLITAREEENGSGGTTRLTVIDQTPSQPSDPGESSGVGYGGDRPGVMVSPQRDEDTSLDKDMQKDFDVVETSYGYAVYEHSNKVMDIHTPKVLSQKQIELIIFKELRNRLMSHAYLRCNLAMLKQGQRVQVLNIDKEKDEIKFISEDKQIHGWAHVSKFSFEEPKMDTKANETVKHEDHIDEVLGHREGEKLVYCTKLEMPRWIPLRDALPTTPPPATPESLSVEESAKVVDDKVEMPKDEFIKEHEKLVKELEPMVEEHKEQGKELEEVIEASLDKLARVVHRSDGWHVLSEKGKNLGGPYDSKEKAVKRLRQVEYFKHHASARPLSKKQIKAAETATTPMVSLEQHIQTFKDRMNTVKDTFTKKADGEQAINGLLEDVSFGIELLETVFKDRPEVNDVVENLETELKRLEEMVGKPAEAPVPPAIEPKVEAPSSESVTKENEYKTPRPTTPPPQGFSWAYDPPTGKWELVSTVGAPIQY